MSEPERDLWRWCDPRLQRESLVGYISLEHFRELAERDLLAAMITMVQGMFEVITGGQCDIEWKPLPDDYAEAPGYRYTVYSVEETKVRRARQGK